MANEQTWHFIDKSAWKKGSWTEEPDKISWTDPDTDLPCLIVRNFLGALCGYVGISEEHPFFNNYGLGEARLDVHGGITYGEFCQEDGEFCQEDHAQYGICHIPEPGSTANVFWFGFDCAHAGDLIPGMQIPGMPKYKNLYCIDIYRNVDFVKTEVKYLASQLGKLRNAQ